MRTYAKTKNSNSATTANILLTDNSQQTAIRQRLKSSQLQTKRMESTPVNSASNIQQSRIRNILAHKKTQTKFKTDPEKRSTDNTKANLDTTSLDTTTEKQIDALQGSGSALPDTERNFFESRFQTDFSDVRIHTNPKASKAAESINAKAFTYGKNIAFAAGEYQPGSKHNRHLLAHELTHTIQQTGNTLRREPEKPKPVDPICKDFDLTAKMGELKITADKFKKDADPDQRLEVIRLLKWFSRCASAEQLAAAVVDLDTRLDPTTTASLVAESQTVMGGYTGMFPGYASDMNRRLKGLGASETFEFDDFRFRDEDAKNTSSSRARYRAIAGKTAKAQTAELNRTDILYFRGHSYGRYKSPGMFADYNTEDYRVDLRYLEQTGGFTRVKFIISTSCATLCSEALAVFTPTFPNAVLLGYGGGAPAGGGVTRDAFEKKLKALGKGLLLDQASDVDTIVEIWKKVIESRHGTSDARRKPGYYQNGTVHYWDGKKWYTPTDNKCPVVKDFSKYYPGPLPAASGSSSP